MADLLDRLPGDIEGLVRVCSPVIDHTDGTNAVVTWVGDERDGKHQGHLWVNGEWWRPAEVDLDLTSETGSVHAVWWARRHKDIVWQAMPDDWELLNLAEEGADLTPEQVDQLARLVLRLAGREVPRG